MGLTSPADAAAVEASLALAGEVGGDLAAAVYARLFDEQPQMEILFWRDVDGAIKGEMLMKVFEAILDFIGERKYAHRMIQNEVLTHEGYDVPRAVFATFFGVVGAVVRETCAGGWSAEMEAAWARLLADLDHYVRHPELSA
jgi:hypothetical protein